MMHGAIRHPGSFDGVRNIVGYGMHPPHPRWPGEARLAINFVLNIEEGTEYSIGDGDGRSEATLTEFDDTYVPTGQRDLACESMFEYGSRVGVWRVLKLFHDRGLALTLNACALAVERHTPLAAVIRERQYDICCHGWRWIDHALLSEEDERTHIRRAVESLERTVGYRPLGWCCRTGPSVNTRRLLVEAGGFVYDSDAYNDELPYWIDVGGTPHLVVPYTHTNNDSKFAPGPFASGRDYDHWHRDAFDWLYAEGATAPKMMSIGLHSRMIGHPARIGGLARFLDHVASHADVWVCSRGQIAKHWQSFHAPAG